MLSLTDIPKLNLHCSDLFCETKISLALHAFLTMHEEFIHFICMRLMEEP